MSREKSLTLGHCHIASVALRAQGTGQTHSPGGQGEGREGAESRWPSAWIRGQGSTATRSGQATIHGGCRGFLPKRALNDKVNGGVQRWKDPALVACWGQRRMATWSGEIERHI